MHLWLALSPHGYGHAAMTAPLVAELRRRHPELRLTIQTALPAEFLRTRYPAFEHVPHIPDIGFRMKSPTEVDVAASAAFYAELHADFAQVVETEANRLRLAAPDLVLANVPYVTIAAAGLAGIPVVAFSSLNWADMVGHYLGKLDGMAPVVAEIHAAYAQAAVFLRATPAQPMTLPRMIDIGPVASLGRNCRHVIAERLPSKLKPRVGLIAYGGIEHRLPLESWPVLDGWFWLGNQPDMPRRDDMVHWQALNLPFQDVSTSVDLLVTKPGYGTFTEAGLSGTPVLYEPRPDWPESPALEAWLAKHTRCLPAFPAQLLSGQFPLLLQKLFSLSEQTVASPTGIGQGADIIDALLAGIPENFIGSCEMPDRHAATSNSRE